MTQALTGNSWHSHTKSLVQIILSPFVVLGWSLHDPAYWFQNSGFFKSGNKKYPQFFNQLKFTTRMIYLPIRIIGLKLIHISDQMPWSLRLAGWVISHRFVQEYTVVWKSICGFIQNIPDLKLGLNIFCPVGNFTTKIKNIWRYLQLSPIKTST